MHSRPDVDVNVAWRLLQYCPRVQGDRYRSIQLNVANNITQTGTSVRWYAGTYVGTLRIICSSINQH